jgi:hypothetical protein
MPTDPVRGTVNLRLTLTEGAVVRKVLLQNALKVTSDSNLTT